MSNFVHVFRSYSRFRYETVQTAALGGDGRLEGKGLLGPRRDSKDEGAADDWRQSSGEGFGLHSRHPICLLTFFPWTNCAEKPPVLNGWTCVSLL